MSYLPKFSLQMYTLRESMKTPEDLEKTFARVAQMGYKSIQITKPAFVETSADLAAQLKRHGLHADSAICTVYSIPEQLDQIVRDSEILETNVLRTDSIRKEDRYSIEGYRNFAKHLNHCGKLLRQHGLDFMYHFHAFEWIDFDGTRGMDILLNETDPEYVMFQPDLFWLTSAGLEPSRALELFKGRIRYIHCKDYVIRPPMDGVLEMVPRASAPVGTGNLHWSEIIETAEKLGVENFVAEDDLGILDPFVSAETSLSNMEKMFRTR